MVTLCHSVFFKQRTKHSKWLLVFHSNPFRKKNKQKIRTDGQKEKQNLPDMAGGVAVVLGHSTSFVANATAAVVDVVVDVPQLSTVVGEAKIAVLDSSLNGICIFKLVAFVLIVVIVDAVVEFLTPPPPPELLVMSLTVGLKPFSALTVTVGDFEGGIICCGRCCS